MTIERITTKDHTGNHNTVLVEILSETDRFIFGQQVDKDGVKTGHYNADGVLVETQHYIDAATITKRVPMEQDRQYGGLKPVEKHLPS